MQSVNTKKSKPVVKWFLYFEEPDGSIAGLHYVQGSLFWEYTPEDIAAHTTQFSLKREALVFAARDNLAPLNLKVGKLTTTITTYRR